MTMRCLLAVLLMLPFFEHAAPAAQQVTGSPAGDAERGKVLWLETEHVECRDCHGENGEGGFGPDLAGRNLTRAQFIHAIRKPWGVMPAFGESQISDQELTDLMAFFDGLASVEEPAPWRREVPTGGPRGLVVATTAGCTQCHHPRFNNGRGVMGGIDARFEWFLAIVYAHEATYPATRASLGDPPFERLAMGSFSPSRVTESMLRDVWTYLGDLGFRARMRGQLSTGAPSSDGVVYTLDVENTGVEGTGLTAEDLTVTLIVPAGAAVVTASGAGYQGVRRDEEANADVAVWDISSMAAGDSQMVTLTLSQAATVENNLRGTIRWLKPTVSTGPSDSQNIAPAVRAVEAH